MRDQLGPLSSLLTVTLFGDQLGPTYQCDRLSKTTTEKFGWTKRQPRQHPWVKLPAQTRKIAHNLEKVQKFSMKCIRATYFYQSPYLCWRCWKSSQSNVEGPCFSIRAPIIVDNVEKALIKCPRATYSCQSPYLCWQCWKSSQSNVEGPRFSIRAPTIVDNVEKVLDQMSKGHIFLSEPRPMLNEQNNKHVEPKWLWQWLPKLHKEAAS